MVGRKKNRRWINEKEITYVEVLNKKERDENTKRINWKEEAGKTNTILIVNPKTKRTQGKEVPPLKIVIGVPYNARGKHGIKS